MLVTLKRIAGFASLGALACAALLHGGCEGTSSGADNPAISVAFRDDAGSPVRVTGDLDVYAYDQNPAVDPQPLWTIKVNGHSVVKLTADDVDRFHAAGKVSAANPSAAKVSAGGSEAALDGQVRFNLSFRGQSLTGLVFFGLAYDPAIHSFTNSGVRTEGIDVRPAPLTRYRASLVSEGLHLDGVTRIYIPGTPFATSLTDSGFVFENIPAGSFPLRVLAQDGRILAVNELLDFRADTMPFTMNPIPLDTLGASPIPTPDFKVVVAPPKHDTVRETQALLAARIEGISPMQKGLLFEWKLIGSDTLDAFRRPFIEQSNQLQTVVHFKARGEYVFRISATLVQKTVYDTLRISALEPLPARAILSPAAGDTVVLGDSTRILWSPPFAPRILRIEVSTNGGQEWNPITGDFLAKDSSYTWIPDSSSLRESHTCRVRVLPSDDTLRAIRSPLFTLARRTR